MTMEMKKNWMDPRTIVQDFVPNEYVAACGDTGTAYKFVCDAVRPGAIFDSSSVYTKDGRYLGDFHPCSETHIVDKTDDFLDGYIESTLGGIFGGKTDVVIWRGTDGNDLHCTTKLDQTTWEVAKS